MKLKRLNASGIEQFAQYLSQLRADGGLPPPMALLNDPGTTESLGVELEIDRRPLPSRLEAARYLDRVLSLGEFSNVERDEGLWAWLTLHFFDDACPAKQDGKRKPSKEVFRYIPAVKNFQKYYRHLLLGPYVIYRAHRDHINDAMSVLQSPVSIINDVVEQIAARAGWISNQSVVAVATQLYIDSESGGYKVGAGGKGNGSPRRLSEILDQFDLTYDLFGISASSLLDLLPREFDRFKK